MKKLLFCSLVLMMISPLAAEDLPREKKPVAGLVVKVTNLENNKGKVRVAVFATEKSWLKTPLDGKVVTPSELVGVAVFTDLKPGTYAISTYDDVNDNGELDTNFIGIPTERYGFSNNASGTFGPPDFADASFKYEGESMEIAIKVE